MRKLFSYFVLLAAGLLIGTNVWANLPERPTPMVEPQGFQMNPDVNGSVQKAPMRKLAQNAEDQQVRLQYGLFDQTFTGDRALQDAFDALPANSTPAFVTLLTDVNVPTTQTTVTVAQYHNVTLDLNGNNVYGATNVTGTSAVITNNGTLTIEDKVGGGSISNLEENPEDYKTAGKTYPSYAYNVITNCGTLTINGGDFVNYTESNSSYIVDNNSSARSATFIMNGGHLYDYYTDAIRLFCNSTTSTNEVIVNGGVIEGYCAIWMQNPNDKMNLGSLTINGGTIKTTQKAVVNGTEPYANASTGVMIEDSENMYLTINGGEFFEGVTSRSNSVCHIAIYSGTFHCPVTSPGNNIVLYGGYYTMPTYTESYLKYEKAAEKYYPDKGYSLEDLNGWGYYTKEQLEARGYTVYDLDEKGPYAGCGKGSWWGCWLSEYRFNNFFDNAYGWIADGFCPKYISDNGDGTETLQIVPKTNKEVVTPDEESNTITWTGNADESDKTNPVETDVVTIKNTNTEEGKNTTVVVDGNVKVNQITVTKEEGSKGEAQIVVKDGATLNVGNGGIVSENDILTTVLVESGGTLIVGTNGIDKEGNATPIEIQASEGKGSGVLIFSPNSKAEDTKKYAEVDLYTYCKKVNGKYHWQQFAIPVTGLTNDKVVKTPNMTSYVFEWDYATYGWSQLNNWAQLDEPFAGYDVTNISENGGVVYTFKGELIGNQNIQLTLPHKNYCVMGNSYTAPIDITALFEQISKEMDQSEEGTIEKTVYKYDAKAGYYVYTNELEQTLAKIGIMNAAFTDIKPMEGFLLNLQNGNTAGVMLNYANAVFTPATKSTAPASVPARQAATTDMMIAKMMVNSANYTDCMTLVEGEEFSADIENGKDAYKYINEDGINLYAFNDNAKLAMLASDNIEGTNIAFQSAADDEYTLTFQNVINNEYELLDLQTNIRVPMIEGNAYTFTATPNTLNPSRFMLVASRATPTGTEKVKGIKQVKGIYTMLGQYMGETEAWSSLPAGVYVVNGVQMAK